MATQTGSIDLTASNSVKLAAEAGWQSDLDGYYTKSEIDVTVGGINSEVSKKVNGTEIISTINQSAESVSINANKINLQGAVTISDLSSDAQNATLNSNISVGGRNLLTDSESMASWNKGPLATVNDGVVELAGTTSTWGASIDSSKYDIGYYDGTTSYVWSFDYKSTADCVIVPVIASTAATVESFSWTRTKYTNWQANFTAPSTSGEWARLVLDPRTISVNQLTSGSGNVVSGYLQVYVRSNTTIYIRHMKLEKGNVATDWTPALEDMAVTVGGRNLLLQSNYNSSFTQNGITFTNNGDGSVTANGTATGLAAFLFAPHVTLDSGTYTLSGCPPTGSDSTYRLDILDVPTSTGVMNREDYGEGRTFETVGGTTNAVRLRVASGATVNNVTVYPKLERGNKATDWTPAPEDVDSAISDAAKTATSYVTDITGGGVMVHPSDDATSGVQITSDVDIMRDGTSVINIGTNDAVRIGVDDNAHVKMLLESDAMSIENESGSEIFSIDSGSTGTSTVALTASLVTWSTTASVDTTTRTVSDTGTAAGTTTVTATINGTEYALSSTYATATVTAGTGVSVALTSAGVTYVQGLMVVTVDEGESTVTTTYPCELSVTYQHTVTDKALLSLIGSQTIRGEGDALYIVNDKWTSTRHSNTMVRVRNATTGREIKVGVGSDGYGRGLWDSFKGNWIIYRSTNDQTVINGTNFSVDANGYVKSNGETVNGNLLLSNGWSKVLRSSWSSSNQKPTFHWAENSVTGQRVAFGIGNNGYDRGVWDSGKQRWIVVKDQSDQVYYYGLHSNFEIDAATILSGSTSISGGGIQTGTKSISRSGWYPVAIAGWNANTRYALPARLYLSARGNGTGTISWGIYNPGGSAQTPTVTAYVLWVRGD